MAKTILIIDDEKTIRWSLAEALAASGYETVDADTAAAGITRFRETCPDLVLLDMKLPDGSGLDVLKALEAAGSPEGRPRARITMDSVTIEERS